MITSGAALSLHGVDPDTLGPWARIFRDFALVGVGVFMLVYETLSQDEPRATIIGAGLALLGAPQAIRLVTGKKKEGGASETATSQPSA